LPALVVVAQECAAELGQPFGRVLELAEDRLAFGGRERDGGELPIEHRGAEWRDGGWVPAPELWGVES
jgi:hypothetical protein